MQPNEPCTSKRQQRLTVAVMGPLPRNWLRSKLGGREEALRSAQCKAFISVCMCMYTRGMFYSLWVETDVCIPTLSYRGKKESELMEKAKIEAAVRIFKDVNLKSEADTIDLHGQQVEAAIKILEVCS